MQELGVVNGEGLSGLTTPSSLAVFPGSGNFARGGAFRWQCSDVFGCARRDGDAHTSSTLGEDEELRIPVRSIHDAAVSAAEDAMAAGAPAGAPSPAEPDLALPPPRLEVAVGSQPALLAPNARQGQAPVRTTYVALACCKACTLGRCQLHHRDHSTNERLMPVRSFKVICCAVWLAELCMASDHALCTAQL